MKRYQVVSIYYSQKYSENENTILYSESRTVTFCIKNY